MKKITLISVLLLILMTSSFAQDDIFALTKYIGDEFNVGDSVKNVVKDYDQYVFEWTSSDYKVMNLMPNGDAKCLKNGKIQLIGYDELKDKRVYINVIVKSQVDGLELGPKQIIIPAESKLNLKYQLLYDYSIKLKSDRVLWTSSDEKVIKVDEKGTVTSLKEGSAYIIATSIDGSHKEFMKIKVAGKELDVDIAVIDDLYVGSSSMILIKKNKVEKNAQDYTFFSSDDSIASVSKDGKVTARGVGIAYITVNNTNSERKVIAVKVKASVKKISLNKEKLKIVDQDKVHQIEYKLYYTADIKDENKLTKVKFESSSPNVAYVTKKGEIIARSSGVTTITISTNNGNTKDSLEVEVDFPINDSIIYNFKFVDLPSVMYVGEVAKLDYEVKNVYSKPEFKFTVSKGSNKQIFDENGEYYFKPDSKGTLDINVKGPNGFLYKHPISIRTKLSKIDMNTGMYTKESDGYRLYYGQDMVIEPNVTMIGSYDMYDLLSKGIKLTYDNDYLLASSNAENIISSKKIGESKLTITSDDSAKIFNTKIYIKSAIYNSKFVQNQNAEIGKVYIPKLDNIYVHGLGRAYDESAKIELISQAIPEDILDEELKKTLEKLDELKPDSSANRTLINRLKSRKFKLNYMKANVSNGYATIQGDLYGLDGRIVKVANIYDGYLVGIRKGTIKVKVTLNDNGKTVFGQIEIK